MKTVTEEYRIKGMICSRCLKVLKDEFKKNHAEVLELSLGRIKVRYSPLIIERSAIRQIVQENGFEIIFSKDMILAEEIKHRILEYIHAIEHSKKLSDFLREKLNCNYDIISKKFSKSFGITIERYCTMLKIERVKEFIENGDLRFSEIAYLSGYQNLSALSRKFKQETGMTMKKYQSLGMNLRIPLDKIG